MAGRILIAVDMSEASKHALEVGGRLAQDLEADVVLVHAFEPIPRVPMDLSASADYERLIEMQARSSQAQAHKLTTEMAEKLRKMGLEVEVVAKDGDPEDVILQAAEDHDVQMMVLGSHGRKGFKRFLLGSVAQSTLQQAKRPVVVVPMSGD